MISYTKPFSLPLNFHKTNFFPLEKFVKYENKKKQQQIFQMATTTTATTTDE